MKTTTSNINSQKEKETAFLLFRSVESSYAAVYSQVQNLEKLVDDVQQRWIKQENMHKIRVEASHQSSS